MRGRGPPRDAAAVRDSACIAATVACTSPCPAGGSTSPTRYTGVTPGPAVAAMAALRAAAARWLERSAANSRVSGRVRSVRASASSSDGTTSACRGATMARPARPSADGLMYQRCTSPSESPTHTTTPPRSAHG